MQALYAKYFKIHANVQFTLDHNKCTEQYIHTVSPSYIHWHRVYIIYTSAKTGFDATRRRFEEVYRESAIEPENASPVAAAAVASCFFNSHWSFSSGRYYSGPARLTVKANACMHVQSRKAGLAPGQSVKRVEKVRSLAILALTWRVSYTRKLLLIVGRKCVVFFLLFILTELLLVSWRALDVCDVGYQIFYTEARKWIHLG